MQEDHGNVPILTWGTEPFAAAPTDTDKAEQFRCRRVINHAAALLELRAASTVFIPTSAQ
jgi:hypothetical protein